MKILTVLLFLVASQFASSQEFDSEHVETEIDNPNVFDLSIIQVYPDSFPKVSVVFQAKNNMGKPLWSLDKDDFMVTENGTACDVTRLVNITEDEPLNIGLVIDHSSSMFYNSQWSAEEKEQYLTYYNNRWKLPDSVNTAMDFAKDGSLNFLQNTGFLIDSILVTGFSTDVDNISELSTNTTHLSNVIKNMRAEGATSFYDALYNTIEKLSISESLGVIVALTDGQDNSSSHSQRDVIDLAQKNNVRVYVIGLGNVYDRVLRELSNETDGLYYHTEHPEQLTEIYLNIKNQIRSVYQLDYTSLTQEYAENGMNLVFSFTNDTLTFSDNSELFNLPDQAISYLKQLEAQRLQKLNDEKLKRNLIIGGGVLLLGIASFVIYRRKKSSGVTVSNVFPNPFQNSLTIEYSSDHLVNHLKIIDSNGLEVFTDIFNGKNGMKQMDLSHLPSGNYIIKLVSPKGSSATKKIIKS